MEIYCIYQTIGKHSFTETVEQERRYAGHVIANSLEMAYQKSQNGDIPWNHYSPCRSTSIGDIIETNGEFHMVCSFGFKLLVEPEDNEPEHDSAGFTQFDRTSNIERNFLEDEIDELTEADYWDGDASHSE
jgi:hypothetical protein